MVEVLGVRVILAVFSVILLEKRSSHMQDRTSILQKEQRAGNGNRAMGIPFAEMIPRNWEKDAVLKQNAWQRWVADDD